jgi:uncharacterized membrane protein YjjP (DUF1212 family)
MKDQVINQNLNFWDFTKLWQSGFFVDVAIIFGTSIIITTITYLLKERYTTKTVVDLGRSTWIIKH